MVKKALIEESLKEKKSELFEIDGNMFRVNYLPKMALNRLEEWVKKLSKEDARAMHLTYATDINHTSETPTEFVDAAEAVEKYIDFIKVCTLYTNREMMEEALRSAPKKKDGTLSGRRVQHLAFTGLAINFSFYELCAVNETDNVMLIEIRSTDCSHKYLPFYESSKSCQEIINEKFALLPDSIKNSMEDVQKSAAIVGTIPSEIKKQFKIEKNDSGFTVSNYKGDNDDVIIPDYIGNTPVTVIGAYTFFQQSIYWGASARIKTITIPNTVKKIENGVFKNCRNLREIVIPSSVIQLGQAVFSGCSNLSSILLSDNIKSIGQNAFSGCSHLTEIKLPAGLKKITQYMFFDCPNLLSLTIPEGVTDIQCTAFENDTNLSKVVIPNSVKNIHEAAFLGCEKLAIYAEKGSYAEEYAKKNNINFVAVQLAREEKRKTHEADEAVALRTAEQKAREKKEAQAEIEGRCERFIEELKRQHSISDGTITQKELFEKANQSEITESALTRYIELKYNQSPKDFFGSLGIVRTQQNLHQDFNEILALLKERYKDQPRPTEVTQVMQDNADLDLSIIVNNAKKFTNMTARELLLSEGILAVEEAPSQADLFVGVLHMPGNEPDNIKRRLSTLFAKLDGAYPDKVIEGLNREHKKWGETVTELYRLLGYANSRNFLMAYGYTVADNKGGRTANKNEEIIAELKRRYPRGSFFTTVAQLKEANADLAPKIKSLENTAPTLYGMPLKQYLISLNILASLHQGSKDHGCAENLNQSIEHIVFDLNDNPVIEATKSQLINNNEVDHDPTHNTVETIENEQNSDEKMTEHSSNGQNVSGSTNKPSNISKLSIAAPSTFQISRGAVIAYNGKAGRVILPAGATKVAENAFASNDKIIALEVPEGYKKIEANAFKKCEKLRVVKIGAGMQTIEMGAFYSCTSLESAEIADGITQLSAWLFYNCVNLKEFVIPQSVTNIMSSVFEKCTSLKKICIPYGVTTLGRHVFLSCTGLRDIYIPATVTMIGLDTFKNCSNFTLHVEEGSRAERFAKENGYAYDYNMDDDLMRQYKASYYNRLAEAEARRMAEETERKAREEAERKAREEAERKAREEAERRAREEAERKASEERKVREEAERKAREEVERKVHEAEQNAREEAERKACEEVERLKKLQEERRAQKLCQHCGGNFKGLFSKKCASCGRKKDY